MVGYKLLVVSLHEVLAAVHSIIGCPLMVCGVRYRELPVHPSKLSL
jgi:hypothetical protein